MKTKTVSGSIMLGRIPCYTAKPLGGASRALILFPEAFGLTGHIQDVAHRFAREGFSVYVPQLYLNKEVNFSIDYSNKLLREELLSELNSSWWEEALVEAKSHFSKYDSLSVVGFSIGGYFAFLSASILKVNKLVAFYPNPTPNNLNYRLTSLSKYLPSCPESLVFFGEKDHSIVASERELLAKGGKGSCITYEAQHGFFLQ